MTFRLELLYGLKFNETLSLNLCYNQKKEASIDSLLKNLFASLIWKIWMW